MHDRVNSHDRFGTRRAAVVSGQFAEGTFDLFRSWKAFPFQNNFRCCRNRQTGEFSANDVDGFALNAADEVVLANAVGYFERAGEKDQRVMPHGDRHFEWLSARERLVAMDPAVAPRSDIKADSV